MVSISYFQGHETVPNINKLLFCYVDDKRIYCNIVALTIRTRTEKMILPPNQHSLWTTRIHNDGANPVFE